MSPILQCFQEHQFKILNELSLYRPARVKHEPVGKTKKTKKQRQKEILLALKKGPAQTVDFVDLLSSNAQTIYGDCKDLELNKKIYSVKIKTEKGKIVNEWRWNEKD